MDLKAGKSVPAQAVVLLVLAVSWSAHAAAPLRPLLGYAGYRWVDDTVRLAGKLAFAKNLGYNAFICHFDAPAAHPAGPVPDWMRGPETGYRWKMSDGPGPGGQGARSALISKIKAVKRLTERNGMTFIPDAGAMGWGWNYAAIDPGTVAGVFYDMEIPDRAENLFSTPGFLKTGPGWGDASGASERQPSSGNPGKVRITLKGRGMFAAHYEFIAPWDAYLRFGLPVEVRSGTGRDSATLKAYEFNGWEKHPYSTKCIVQTGARFDANRARPSVSFFVRKGATYFLDLEYHCRSPKGGWLAAGKGELTRLAPPRDLLLDTRAYERRDPAGSGSGRSYLAGHGHPMEAEVRTLISSRSPRLDSAEWFSLDPARSDSAWASLTAVRGTFKDLTPEALLRAPLDPLAPATRQITGEILDAVAEAVGPDAGYLHLGGDEMFSLQRSRRQRTPPFAGMSKAGLYAHLIRDRMAQADSVFARRFPNAGKRPVYMIYGDMLTHMSGRETGTLGAADSLGPGGVGRGRLIVMPWYYATHVSGLPFDRPFRKAGSGIPDGLLRTMREDAARLSKAGVDFIGLYSTDGTTATLAEQAAGAEMWKRVCGEFSGSGTSGTGSTGQVSSESRSGGRCLGLAYAGWDTALSSPWGRNYNGLVMLAKPWKPSPDSLSNRDSDGDGVLDALEAVGGSQ